MTSTLVDTYDENVRNEFALQYESAEPRPWVTNVGRMLDSDKPTEKYFTYDVPPTIYEYGGNEVTEDFGSQTWELTNQQFASGINYNWLDVARQRNSEIEIQAQAAVNAYNGYWEKQVTDLILAGTTSTGSDGVAFYATTHTIGAGNTISNLLTYDISGAPVADHGTVTNPSIGEMVYAIFAGVNGFEAMLTQNGSPVHVNPSRYQVLAPSTFSAALIGAINGQLIGRGDTNALMVSQADFVGQTLPQLTSDADAFYMFRMDDAQKAIILQDEISPDMQTTRILADGKFRIPVLASRTVGFANWLSSVKITLI